MAMIHLEPQTAQMFSRALGALKPPPNLTLSQWADNYRRLSAEASAAQGRWNTDNIVRFDSGTVLSTPALPAEKSGDLPPWKAGA